MPKISKAVQGLLKSPYVVRNPESKIIGLPPTRLGWQVSEMSMLANYGSLAEWVRSLSLGTAFYLDTNFYTGETKPIDLWKSLLTHRVVVPQLIGAELEAWLTTPRRNEWMRWAMSGHLLRQSPSVRLNDRHGWSQEQTLAAVYYITLLGTRKRLAQVLVQEFLDKHGREPDAKEFTQIVHKTVAEHERNLVQKGRDDAGKPNFYADEQLVVCAYFDALINCRQTVILTTDADVALGFTKMQSLLDGQYQAMLFAERFAADRSSFQTKPLLRTTDILREYFADDEGLLVRKPTPPGRPLVDWLLPNIYDQVGVHCLHFGGDGTNLKVTSLRYAAETPMARLLEIKGTTDGLNTDKLNGFNFHATGGPEGIEDARDWAIVARDLCDFDGMRHYPKLDIAVSNYEKY